jgi:hypothetical protein
VKHPIYGNKREQVHELKLREPTAGDILRCGNPLYFNTDGMHIHEQKMNLMIAALSGILPPLLEAMHPQDWMACAYRLRPFFLPDPAAW